MPQCNVHSGNIHATAARHRDCRALRPRKRARAVPDRFAPAAPESASPPPKRRSRGPGPATAAEERAASSDEEMPDAAEGEPGIPFALLESAHAEAAALGDTGDEPLPNEMGSPDAFDADGFPLALADKVPRRQRSETGPRRWGAKGLATSTTRATGVPAALRLAFEWDRLAFEWDATGREARLAPLELPPAAGEYTLRLTAAFACSAACLGSDAEGPLGPGPSGPEAGPSD
eukprot:tig00021127_g18848.t1